MSREDRPIGYWLKHLDRLIERAFQRAFQAEKLTRRQWQVLNVVGAKPATPAEIDDALAPFLADDPAGARTAAEELERHGWLRRTDGGRIEPTERGYQGHAAIEQRVTTIRQLLRRGVTDEQYRAVVATLERMAENLESADH